MTEERVTLSTLQPLRLSDLAAGNVEKQFQEELAKVRDVLSDPQRSGPCRVSIHLDFKPEESSQIFLRLESSVSSKLPARKSARIITLQGGELLEETTSMDARQPGLFPVRETEDAQAKTK